MNILTITTQYANNMGAILQCYALSKFLNNQKNINCNVIQYYPSGAKKSWLLFRGCESFRNVLSNIYMLFRPDLLFLKYRKNSKMRKFINEYIPLTKEKYNNREAILKKPPFADVYICGSDQIWNFKYRMDFTFFLDFSTKYPKSRRIAYAPSIADPWTEEQCRKISPVLKNFDALSVRELENVSQVQGLVDLCVSHVIDPVFLLEKNSWDEILRNPSINGPYIFCYFLSVTDLAIRTVQKLKKMTGYKVVHLNLNTLDKFNSDYNIRISDPSDFIGYISKASIICTNSFHCSAFSIIYKKNFCFIPKFMANSRMDSLQTIFKLGNVFMSDSRLESLQLNDLEINYKGGESVGNEFIDKSKQYLLNALYE